MKQSVELVHGMDLFSMESRPKHKLTLLIASMVLFASVPNAIALSPQIPLRHQAHASSQVQDSEYFQLSLASTYLEKGDYAKALTYLLETVEKNPVNILGLFHLGSAYLELAKRSELPEQQLVFLEQAQQAFERVVDLNDELTLVYFKLGKIALMKNDIEAAKRYYRAGLRSDPQNAALIFNLGRVYDQNNEKKEAIRYYLQTIAADPQFTFAYNNLALLYEENKEFKNAEKAYRKALKKDPNYNLARLNLGNMYASTGKYAAANTLFTEAVAKEPKNEWVYYYQGNMYLRQGKYEEAIQSYNQAVELNPDHATTYYLLAIAFSKLNRMDEAMQASLQYMQLAPDGEYAREMKSLIMAVKLSQSNGLYFTRTPSTSIIHHAKDQ
jgi:tetratricopeptide (TPR) repeat protein